MKAAAKAVGEKSVEMLHVKELLGITGYIRGGCSPIGMKKQFPTVIHEDMILIDTIMVSGGKIGVQVELSPDELLRVTGGKTADIARAKA
jgi:Cys-tRNA(Pro)/Cys-tRNA(Cys) deacylase